MINNLLLYSTAGVEGVATPWVARATAKLQFACTYEHTFRIIFLQCSCYKFHCHWK